ncbi:MAG TPA: Vms1/Ankzf1 family peptidyl-tRNA hydrolase [Gaiellaceae bacterium]|nr:Vms1/Ankzf1 family peptidyl-tRNA hydrolase [Gaiellaceae bacterium]
MAATITWDHLRELAAFRATRGCAVSLYLDLDPSVAPTAGDVQVRVSSLLGEAERRLEDGRGRLDHEARAALRGDLDRIGRWFRSDFDRDGVRGLAVFADGLDNFWSTIETGEPVVDEVKIAEELYLAPLVGVVGRGDGALVAIVGRERGQVFRLEAGRLVEIADRTEDVPSRHDQGGWSQANYERHIETIVDRHLRRVAATLDRCSRSMRGAPIVLVGAEDVRSEFESLLAHETRTCVVGWAAVEAHADGQRLLAAIRPVLDRWWSGREEATLDRWREEAAKKGRASAGWEETLEAASDGRVDLLLVQSGADHRAYECPKCGRAQLADGSCPIDGTAMESRDEGLDVAVHKTLVNGGTVQVIREHRDLEPVGGLAALLRY